MRNTDGDRFATPQLFWDQNERRVYSDSFMHIERAERIIEGYGFESNEAMTEYTVLHPQMILPIDRMRAEREERREAADSLAADSALTPAPEAPARPRNDESRRTRPSMRRNDGVVAEDVALDSSSTASFRHIKRDLKVVDRTSK